MWQRNVFKCGHILRGGIGALIRDLRGICRGSSISQARKLRVRVWERSFLACTGTGCGLALGAGEVEGESIAGAGGEGGALSGDLLFLYPYSVLNKWGQNKGGHQRGIGATLDHGYPIYLLYLQNRWITRIIPITVVHVAIWSYAVL